MKIHLITQFKTSSWSGGSTTELLIIPEDGNYAKREFDLRLSSATVAKDPSFFTPLPGYKRFFTPLDKPLRIMHTDIFLSTYLQPYDLYAFNGTDSIRSDGTARDFNVIYRPELNPTLTVFQPGDNSNLCIHPHSVCAFFTLDGGLLNLDNKEIELPPFSLCLLEVEETESCSVRNDCENPILLVQVEL